MKIKGEVTDLSSNGDTITFTVRGRPVRAPCWMRRQDYDFTVNDTKATRKSFTLGRYVEIDISAK